jgi:large subunit ribosomal protein L24e
MTICDFCKKSIPAGTGKKYVMKSGKIIDFCSNKCEKNMLKLGRKARTTKWTGEYHRVKSGTKG